MAEASEVYAAGDPDPALYPASDQAIDIGDKQSFTVDLPPAEYKSTAGDPGPGTPHASF